MKVGIPMSRAESLGRGLAACVLAFLPIASAADPPGGSQPAQVSARADRNAGLQAFAQIERVILHARCVNCHVPDGPLQGDAKRWQPGPGREPPPLDKPAFDERVRLWISNGAPCDATESLRQSATGSVK